MYVTTYTLRTQSQARKRKGSMTLSLGASINNINPEGDKETERLCIVFHLMKDANVVSV